MDFNLLNIHNLLYAFLVIREVFSCHLRSFVITTPSSYICLTTSILTPVNSISGWKFLILHGLNSIILVFFWLICISFLAAYSSSSLKSGDCLINQNPGSWEGYFRRDFPFLYQSLDYSKSFPITRKINLIDFHSNEEDNYSNAHEGHPNADDNHSNGVMTTKTLVEYYWLRWLYSKHHYIILNNGILKSNSSILPWSEWYITQYTP